MPDRRRQDQRPEEPDPDVAAARLAELVAELTGSEPATALHAVRTEKGRRADALEVVAGAMVTVDQPPPEGFRLAGYLRDDVDDGDGSATADTEG